jgi:hypothetical protein
MDIHNIDLHYHAGQERDPGTSLADYLDHAVVTARRVVGITDHYGLYTEPHRAREHNPYEMTLDGLQAYRDEAMGLASCYPGLVLRFAPELSSRTDLDAIPDRVLAIADYFICETSFPGDTVAENTAAAVQRIEEVGRFCTRTGKPAFIAHPFRSSANYRLVKRDIAPWVTLLEPRPEGDYSPEELARFFLLDLEELGAACVAHNLPLEVNGNTHYRMLCSNLPAAVHMLYSAYRHRRGQGVAFVPGSDQHSFRRSVGRVGGYVPYDTCRAMGFGVEDISFLARIGVTLQEPAASAPAG